MIKSYRRSDDELDEKFAQLPEVVNQLQRAILGQMDDIAAAQKGSLEDELERKRTKFGYESPDVKNVSLRISAHETLRSEIKAEMQRNQIRTPKPKPDCFIIHGRIVDGDGLGLIGLTINAINFKSRSPVCEVCTDKRGYFKLEIACETENNKGRTYSEEDVAQIVLQVSDSEKTELYRDDDAHRVTVGAVVYVEIILAPDST